MRNFKGIIMSEYTSKFTILRHFLKIFSMIHMPPKPAYLSCLFQIVDLCKCWLRHYIILCKKLTFQIKIYTPKLEYLVSFFQNFFEEIYMSLNP